MIRVGVIDDHPLVISGLEAALGTIEDVEVVARAATMAQARSVLEDGAVDVALLDVRLEDGNGLELLAEATGRPRPAVIVLSSFKTPQYVAAALRFGAQGFMLKTAPLEQLVTAIRQVAGGGSAFSADQLKDARSGFVRLTPRERQIVRLVLDGRSNEEIAAALGAARKTVEAHLTHLYERFELGSRVELALRAERDGWLDLDRSD